MSPNFSDDDTSSTQTISEMKLKKNKNGNIRKTMVLNDDIRKKR